MVSMQLSLFSTLFLITLTGVSCQELTPVNNEENSLEGSTVTLSYNYSKAAVANDYFFWYRQYPGKPPEFLISHFGTQLEKNLTNSRLSVKVTEGRTQMNLQISSAAVSDSAVYYCALHPNTQAGYKLYFGSGTKLTVESGNDFKPSYFELQNDNDNSKLCLATGFSRYDAINITEFQIFKGTEPVRISGDSLFNRVAWIKNNEECESNFTQSYVPCEDTLEPGAKVNIMSLTILGLRIIFVKTIIFNVLMTLRLWISQ